LSYLCL